MLAASWPRTIYARLAEGYRRIQANALMEPAMNDVVILEENGLLARDPHPKELYLK